ncbi:MAG: ATP-binding protein, partial [Usitatibacter sp.]
MSLGLHSSWRPLAACAIAVLLGACGGRDASVLEISHARFLATDAPRPPGDEAVWKDQRLPDEWQANHPGVSGYAWYRFTVPQVPAGEHDIAFYLTETRSNGYLLVNGVHVGQTGDLLGMAPQRWEAAQLLALPRSALRAGANTLELRVYVPPGELGGIGKVLVGPYEALYLRSLRDEIAHTIGPTVASLTMVILGLFMLILWLRVRNDRNYLLFAAASMIWGVHTFASLQPRTPIPEPHFAVWWNAVYLLFVVMLGAFCMRFAGARWAKLERAAFVTAAACPAALYVAADFGVLAWATAAARLLAIWFAAVALVVIVRNARRTQDALSWLLLATAAVATSFGVHDWVAAQYGEDLRPVYLVPYVSLFFFALVGWIIIDRFARSLRSYERLTLELEARVAQKSEALEIEVQRQAEARAEAESATLAKSRFLAAASHDLRQPLHALGLFATALDERAKDPGTRELTGRISQSIGDLEALFSEVLDVSRLDAGAVVANPQPVALQALFDRIDVDLSTAAQEKALALRFVPSSRVVVSDPVLLERILRNLVANAIKYTPAGGVLVGARRRGGRIVVEVRDSGVGIGESEQALVFEEFYQVESVARDRHKGLGLGLAIVKRLCTLLGHDIA